MNVVRYGFLQMANNVYHTGNYLFGIRLNYYGLEVYGRDPVDNNTMGENCGWREWMIKEGVITIK